MREPTEQEMLVAASKKLGQYKEYFCGHCQEQRLDEIMERHRHGDSWFCNYCDGRDGPLYTSVLTDLLHSLDAHFAPGGTVEWMRERGYILWLNGSQKGGWRAIFRNSNMHEDIDSIIVIAPTPAMAILKAFLKHGGDK